MQANSQVMMLEEKINQLMEKEASLKETVQKQSNQIDERDSVILDMKKRLECEQTDQIIFENKIKQIEFDLQQQRQQT